MMTDPKEERCLSLYTPTKQLKKTNYEKRETKDEKVKDKRGRASDEKICSVIVAW